MVSYIHNDKDEISIDAYRKKKCVYIYIYDTIFMT